MQSESHVGLGTNTVIGVSTAQEIVYSNGIFKCLHDQDGWCSGTFPSVQRRGKTLQQLQESATAARDRRQLCRPTTHNFTEETGVLHLASSSIRIDQLIRGSIQLALSV